MGKVRILPDELVSKIAAGEIVERPASVLKELVENSLDAGSSHIQIQLRAGGKRLIIVSDDGEGMTRDDALLALERHATSKIRDIKDLFSVNTLGFRGEALPSIASVSRFRLITKTKDEIAGVKISIEGGRVKTVEETGCPQGTTVEVRDLFFNTTPRLKFMKTEETELTNAIDIIEREALSRPGVGFEVSHEEKVIFRLPPRRRMEERLSEVFPGTKLHHVEAESEGVKVYGFISSPEDVRTTTQKLYTYVNGRAVRDRFLTRITIDSYGRMIEKGRFPQGVLFIEIPSGEVDVNVHPTKNEVRFRRQKLVGEVIKAGVFEMLRNAPWIASYQKRVENAVRGFYDKRGSFQPLSGDQPVTEELQGREINHIAGTGSSIESNLMSWLEATPTYIADSDGSIHSTLFKQDGFFSGLEIIGQLGDLYIISASPKGMILIDQHAAHERVNYERFKNAYMKGAVEIQELLVPVVIELSPHEARLLAKQREEMESFGIKLESFGECSFLVRSVPTFIGNVVPETLLKNMIGEIAALGGEKSLEERVDHVIATMACHGSVRGGDRLSREEMKVLLEQLDRARFPHSCPHGRPVAREITFQELEKMFKRS